MSDSPKSNRFMLRAAQVGIVGRNNKQKAVTESCTEISVIGLQEPFGTILWLIFQKKPTRSLPRKRKRPHPGVFIDHRYLRN
jgi:hypothetical protein